MIRRSASNVRQYLKGKKIPIVYALTIKYKYYNIKQVFNTINTLNGRTEFLSTD